MFEQGVQKLNTKNLLIAQQHFVIKLFKDLIEKSNLIKN